LNDINTYLTQLEKDLFREKDNLSNLEHWFSKTNTMTSQEQLEAEIIKIIKDNGSEKFKNDIKILTGKINISDDEAIKLLVKNNKIFKFKDFTN